MAKALDKNEDKNELVAQQEAGLLDLSQLDDVDIEFTGLEEIGQGDIKLGKWKLLQPTSAEVTKDIPPGSFYNTVTKEVREELIVTVLKTSIPASCWATNSFLSSFLSNAFSNFIYPLDY